MNCVVAVVVAVAVTIMMASPTTTTALEWRARSSLEAGWGSPDLGRHHPILFANESHAFLLGGTTYTATAANDFYLYDVANDVWTPLDVPDQDSSNRQSSFPPARSFAYGIVLNELYHPKAYLGFGADGDGQPLRDWWEFDMTTLTFRELAPCPCRGRSHPSLVPVYTTSNNNHNDDNNHNDGQWTIHMGLGDSFDDDGQFINLNDYWQYDIATNVWQALPDFPASQRHHPYYFPLSGASYVGLGHSGSIPYIERDFYSYHPRTNEWRREPDFASYENPPPPVLLTAAGTATSSLLEVPVVVTSEARVAGTQFAIEFPLVGTTTGPENLTGALGFVLSGDGDDHDYMATGEFHAFYPATTTTMTMTTTNTTMSTTTATTTSTAWWRQLTPHPGGGARWAPGSFVVRNTATAYFCCGYNRATETLHSDLWTVDLSSLFTTTTTTITGGGIGSNSSSNNNNNNAPLDDDDEEENNAVGSTSVPAAASTSRMQFLGTKNQVASSVIVVTMALTIVLGLTA